ncbi:MAG TPA: hydroxymethylglutaryl-CoA lyase [Bacteroidia bacterium]|nr:hydroxymethylglutaryl-CoA lyase [Bacteroidia bacterium]
MAVHSDHVLITECPRDAMQGIHDFIPTEKKKKYINSILKCGFDTVDFGSFVSPKAIPQMRDTAEVLKGLDIAQTKSKLLAIIANVRGAEEASLFDEITYLGFPFSISETFQQRNTNSSIAESLKRVEEIQSICVKKKKELVIYISMAFGNPYGDPWNADVSIEWTKKLSQLGITIFAMADTIGVSNPENITYLFSHLLPAFPKLKIGAHLHTTPDKWEEKINAAYHAGCRRFDSAIKGFGGCPMAADKLTGNMPTENLLGYLDKNKINTGIDAKAFLNAMAFSSQVFI